MDYTLPVAWTRDRRGFWTKRKKTAMSLVTVMAVLASIALAFKLFDQAVPNNVVRDASTFNFEIWKLDEEAGDTAYVQAGTTMPIFQANNNVSGNPIEIFPGDERLVNVKIINTNDPPKTDASFQVYVDAIIIKDGAGLAPGNPAQANRFLNLWNLHIDKEKVLSPGGDFDVANEDDHGAASGGLNANPDTHLRPEPISFTEACDNDLRLITRQNPCKLGLVREKDAEDLLGGRTDQRYYLFKLLEEDSGDQTEFVGWSITFNLVFQARVPPEPETVLLER